MLGHEGDSYNGSFYSFGVFVCPFSHAYFMLIISHICVWHWWIFSLTCSMFRVSQNERSSFHSMKFEGFCTFRRAKTRAVDFSFYPRHTNDINIGVIEYGRSVAQFHAQLEPSNFHILTLSIARAGDRYKFYSIFIPFPIRLWLHRLMRPSLEASNNVAAIASWLALFLNL